MTPPCRITAYSGFSVSLFQVFSNINEILSGKQEKESIIRVTMGMKNPSLAITECHHSARFVMQIGDPMDKYLYPCLTLMIDTSSFARYVSMGFN